MAGGIGSLGAYGSVGGWNQPKKKSIRKPIKRALHGGLKVTRARVKSARKQQQQL